MFVYGNEMVMAENAPVHRNWIIRRPAGGRRAAPPRAVLGHGKAFLSSTYLFINALFIKADLYGLQFTILLRYKYLLIQGLVILNF